MTKAVRRTLFAFALSALALLSLPACSKEGDGGGGLRVDEVAAIGVGSAPVYSVTVAAGRVAWTVGDSDGRPPFKVMLLEKGDTKAAELVHTQYPNGYVPHVRLSSEWAVFADLSSSQPAGGGVPQEPWRVEALHLETGERVLVTEQSPTARDDSPAPRIEGDTVVWSARVPGSEGGSESEVFAFDLATRTKRTLARATIGNTAVGGGKVYYDRYSETGSESDVFSVALDNSDSDSDSDSESAAPVQVSRSGQASKPAASRFGLAWVEPPQGNSTTIVLARPGRSPEVFASSSGPDNPVGYNPQVCDGFAIWDPLVGLSARAFAAGDPATVLAPAAELSVQARWACDGDTVAWVAFAGTGAFVHVARVDAGDAR